MVLCSCGLLILRPLLMVIFAWLLVSVFLLLCSYSFYPSLTCNYRRRERLCAHCAKFASACRVRCEVCASLSREPLHVSGSICVRACAVFAWSIFVFALSRLFVFRRLCIARQYALPRARRWRQTPTDPPIMTARPSLAPVVFRPLCGGAVEGGLACPWRVFTDFL